MLYPEFRDAEYSTTDIPAYNPVKYYLHIIFKYIILFAIFIATNFGTYYFFNIIISETAESIYINAISVGASIVTIFSAIISVLSLLDVNCLKKYDDNLHLLESRYLEGKKISGWEFFHRCSHFFQSDYNYYIDSACYKLYSGNENTQNFIIIVPALEIDFHDIPCIKQIYRIRKFIPEYLKYLKDEQRKYLNNANCKNSSTKQPNYFIPLPYHIIALYRKILMHRIIKNTIIFCFMFIVSAVVMAIIWMI